MGTRESAEAEAIDAQTAARRADDDQAARLVAQVQAGDREAFAILYDLYFDKVYAYLRTMLRSPHDAQDVAQQVFASVFEALPTYEHRRSFWVWLFTVVKNHALKELRRKQGHAQAQDPTTLDLLRDTNGNGEDDDAEIRSLSWITDKDIFLFVERLPLPQRQVLVMRYMLDLPISEIATILNATPNEITLTHGRAMNFLRKRLKAIGRIPADTEPQAQPWRQRTKSANVARSRRYALSSKL